MSNTSEVIVVGGGVIAKATALALSDYDKSVIIVAPAELEKSSASRAAGAMLGSFAEFSKDKDEAADRAEGELRIRAGRMWSEWYSRHAEGGEHVDAVHRGTYIIANNMGLSDVENAEYIQRRADKYGERNEWVDPKDVLGLHPHRLSRPQRVLHLPDEGYIDSGVLQKVLDDAIARRPEITVVDNAVVHVALDGNRPSVTTRSGVVYSAADLVIAAGVESTNLLSLLELPVHQGIPQLLGGRGVSMMIEGELQFDGVFRTPNRDFSCGSHLVPLAEGRTYLGATNRLETSGFASPKATIGELHALCHSLANEMNVRLRTASVLEYRVGYRPISSDGYPIYGATAHPNVFVATGTYRNGILMAPAIADAVARDVTGQLQEQENNFTPLGRQRLFVDRDINATMVSSLRQVVSFMQEPDGNLPYGRAAELERLLAGLLEAAVGIGDSEFPDMFAEVTSRYPIAEAMPLLLYKVNNQ